MHHAAPPPQLPHDNFTPDLKQVIDALQIVLLAGYQVSRKSDLSKHVKWCGLNDYALVDCEVGDWQTMLASNAARMFVVRCPPPTIKVLQGTQP